MKESQINLTMEKKMAGTNPKTSDILYTEHDDVEINVGNGADPRSRFYEYASDSERKSQTPAPAQVLNTASFYSDSDSDSDDEDPRQSRFVNLPTTGHESNTSVPHNNQVKDTWYGFLMACMAHPVTKYTVPIVVFTAVLINLGALTTFASIAVATSSILTFGLFSQKIFPKQSEQNYEEIKQSSLRV